MEIVTVSEYTAIRDLLADLRLSKMLMLRPGGGPSRAGLPE